MSVPADSAPVGGPFAALAVPHYPRLWASGFLWNLTRWMSVFLCSFLVSDLTGSPLLVQLVGAAFFAPMFFGGAIGGVISDRFDRRLTMLRQLAALIPVAIAMSALVLSGAVRVWMVYPFILAVGVGGMVDMTSRRALVYDFVGEERVTNAFAWESLSMTGGNMLGNLLGGAIIEAIGMGQAFMGIVICFAVSFVLLLSVRTPPHQAAGARVSLAKDMLEGFRFIRRSRALVSILGITVLMNAFYFTYTPMVPLFADRLGVDAFWTGMLAAASGLGAMAASFLIAARPPRRRGPIYAGGPIIAMIGLLIFAAAGWYPGAFLGVMVAGFGMAGFSALQGVLVMTTAGPAMRGRAIGMVTMAIGTLPFAMVSLGLVAQAIGEPAAVMLSACLGLILAVVWNVRRPEARRLV